MATHSKGHGQGWRHAEFSFNGLAELAEEVKTLPQNLADAAQAIANEFAKDAAAELKTAYPRGPGNRKQGYRGGNLIKGVKYRSGKKRKGKLVAQAWVHNFAPHAWLYDHGTKTRQTKLGRDRGDMPATHLFERITMRYQLNLQDEWIELQRSYGLKVRAA